MKFDIVWHDIVTPTDDKSIMLQIGPRAGFIFLDNQKWCDLCNRTCAHFGFVIVRPGPFGELNGHPIKNPEL